MEKYYVSGCKGQDDDIVTCGDDEAQFWTIYQRDTMGLSQGLVDFTFREDAEAAMKVYVERDALQQKLDAVLAKGMELAQEAAHVYAEYNKEMAPDVVCDGQTIQEFHDLTNGWLSVESYLNSVRAEGIEILTGKLQQLIDEGVFDAKEIGVAAGAVHEGAQMATQLRAGKDGE